jgi:tetratricopeptide (TPR) repeat protein
MKQLAIIFTLVGWGLIVSAQNSKVQSAINYLKPQYNQLDKAKEAIEAAIVNEKTITSPKAWKVRGDVYRAIAETKDDNFKSLSDNPLVIALDSYKKAMELDVKGSMRKEIDIELKLMSFAFINTGIDFFSKENFAKALDCFEGSLEIDRITGVGKIDTMVIYNAGIAADRAKNYDKAIEYFTKTAELRYEGAKVYNYIATIYKEKGDTAMYISSIQKGIQAWPNNNNVLLIELINFYLTTNKSEEALSYLDKAIAADATNASFYYAQGSLYDKIGQIDKAKSSYEKAIELNPEYSDAYYNLGALYYNKAVDMSKEANNIPANKQKEYDEAVKAAMEQLNLSIPYFEKAHAINPLEKNTIIILKEVYFKLRNDHPEYNDKFKEMQEKLNSLPQ